MQPKHSRCFKRRLRKTAFQGHSPGGGTRRLRRAGRRSPVSHPLPSPLLTSSTVLTIFPSFLGFAISISSP